MNPEPGSASCPQLTARPCGSIATMGRFFVSAAVLFVAAGLLAVTSASSCPLLLARVVLIVLGIVTLVVGLRRRRRPAE